VSGKHLEIEGERKQSIGAFNQKIKAAKEEMQNTVKAILDGYEDREVECDWRRNNEKGVMEQIRMDTKEVVGSREMTAEELNRDIFDQPIDSNGENLNQDSQETDPVDNDIASSETVPDGDEKLQEPPDESNFDLNEDLGENDSDDTQE